MLTDLGGVIGLNDGDLVVFVGKIGPLWPRLIYCVVDIWCRVLDDDDAPDAVVGVVELEV